MSYTKIYYDDIWEATSKSSSKCNEWLPELQELSKSIANFVESKSFKGEAATNMKNYLNQVHGTLIDIIGTVVQSYSALAVNYYGGYTRVVDTGDSGKYGLRYTTIVSSEVSETGSIQRKLNKIIDTAEQVVTDANSVKNSIADLVRINSSPKTNNLYEQINAAKDKAQKVHNNAVDFEASRANDFEEIDRLIAQALSVINAQTGTTRTPVIAYQSGSIGDMCDINQILVDLEAISEKITEITEEGYFEEDATLVLNRDALIQEEAEASREWVQWVAMGVAVVGAVVLTFVTWGGATPLVCASVGAITGAVTAATSGIADNYVKNGTFIKGLDVKEFGKDVLVGAVGGAVTGCLGALSTGSAIKQPIERGMSAFAKTVIEEGAKGVTATIWESGETVFEVGQAVIAGKPGDEIISVLNDGLSEMEDEATNMVKKMAVEGAKSFASETVAGGFAIDTSDKSVLKKIGEKTVEGVAEGVAGGTVSTIWGVGEALIDDDSSTTVKSALKEGFKTTVQDVAKETAGAVVSEGVFSGVDGIDSETGKIIGKTVKDTVTDSVKDITKGVTGRTMDYVYGDEKDAGKILGDIWEEDLDGGKKVFEHAGKSLGKHVADEAYKDDKYYNNLKKIDTDKDGNIQVIQFDNYAVTKQDYDAAVKNAGKGAYKDKTVQDILGLPKDTDITAAKERTVSIDMTEKYSSSRKTTDTVTVGGKYTFSRSYYESSVNAANTGQYSGKTVHEILGIPDDVDLSEKNITYKRVDNDQIGRGKEVEFHNDYGTNATKIHISSMKRETRIEREKAKKQNN